MEYEVGDMVYVNESDAPEFRGPVVGISETHLQIERRDGRLVWVGRSRCSRRSRNR